MKYNILVITEAIKIKEYLFDCDKLKAVRGASHSLDYVNTVYTTEIFRNEYSQDGKEVYFGGGNVIALFQSEKMNRAEEFLDKVIRAYEVLAPGSRIVHVIKQAPEDQNISNFIQDAREELSQEKFKTFKPEMLPSVFMQICGFCGQRPVSEYNKDTERYICSVCSHKFKVVKSKEARAEIGIYMRLKEELRNNEIKLPDSFSDMADKSGYIGFLYADGNRMGEFIKVLNLSDKIKNLNFEQDQVDKYIGIFKTFSAAIDNATKKAAVNAVLSHALEDNKLRAEFALAAGDDLIAITPGDRALIIANDFAIKYEENIDNELSRNVDLTQIMSEEVRKKYKLTTGIGVVIAKHTYPFKKIFDISLELQKNAKKRSFIIFMEQELSYSTVDVHLLQNSLPDSIEKLRESKLYKVENCNFYKTLRPFIVINKVYEEEFARDMKSRRNEIFCLSAFLERNENIKGFSKVKLRQINGILDEDNINLGILKTLRYISRRSDFKDLVKKLDADNSRYCNLFPWIVLSKLSGKYYSDIRDYFELSQFITGVSEDTKGGEFVEDT